MWWGAAVGGSKAAYPVSDLVVGNRVGQGVREWEVKEWWVEAQTRTHTYTHRRTHTRVRAHIHVRSRIPTCSLAYAQSRAHTNTHTCTRTLVCTQTRARMHAGHQRGHQARPKGHPPKPQAGRSGGDIARGLCAAGAQEERSSRWGAALVLCPRMRVSSCTCSRVQPQDSPFDMY